MLKFARPIHPGEFLREEYLVPLGMSAGALAKKLNLPRTGIERIVKEEVGLTPDTALRLARFSVGNRSEENSAGTREDRAAGYGGMTTAL